MQNGQQALAFSGFIQCAVIGFDLRHAQQFGDRFFVRLRVLAQIQRCQMEAENLYRPYQWRQAQGEQCIAVVLAQ